MSKLFPIFLNLKNRDVLVVGGGNVALEKIHSLISCHAKITVIAKTVCAEILQLKSDRAGLKIIEREIQASDMDHRFIVFLATNDKKLNEGLAKVAREKKILINAVDDKNLSDFYSAAVFDRGIFRVAVSTEGKFAGFSKMLKNALNEILPEESDSDWECLASLRETIFHKIPDISVRKQILGKVISVLEEEYFAVSRENKNVRK